MVAPPRDLAELEDRASSLTGRMLTEVAASVGLRFEGVGVHTKGKVGTLVELALGATAGSRGVPDFPDLGVELKTIPVGRNGKPTESTFVTSFQVHEAEDAEWETSRAREKLSHVLWVPFEEAGSGGRRLRAPVFWRPTSEQDAILKGDFDELMGLIGIGGIESLTARAGRWLQVRPKAAHGRVRTLALGPDGERLATVPRGFYLRTLFTGALLTDLRATP